MDGPAAVKPARPVRPNLGFGRDGQGLQGHCGTASFLNARQEGGRPVWPNLGFGRDGQGLQGPWMALQP
jgi:hypothetical protein